MYRAFVALSRTPWAAGGGGVPFDGTFLGGCVLTGRVAGQAIADP